MNFNTLNIQNNPYYFTFSSTFLYRTQVNKGHAETVHALGKISKTTVYFRVKVNNGGLCHFSYSLNGKEFHAVGTPFQATEGAWIGAKMGLFCTGTVKAHDSGYADFDWFRITPNK